MISKERMNAAGHCVLSSRVSKTLIQRAAADIESIFGHFRASRSRAISSLATRHCLTMRTHEHVQLQPGEANGFVSGQQQPAEVHHANASVSAVAELQAMMGGGLGHQGLTFPMGMLGSGPQNFAAIFMAQQAAAAAGGQQQQQQQQQQRIMQHFAAMAAAANGHGHLNVPNGVHREDEMEEDEMEEDGREMGVSGSWNAGNGSEDEGDIVQSMGAGSHDDGSGGAGHAGLANWSPSNTQQPSTFDRCSLLQRREKIVYQKAKRSVYTALREVSPRPRPPHTNLQLELNRFHWIFCAFALYCCACLELAASAPLYRSLSCRAASQLSAPASSPPLIASSHLFGDGGA